MPGPRHREGNSRVALIVVGVAVIAGVLGLGTWLIFGRGAAAGPAGATSIGPVAATSPPATGAATTPAASATSGSGIGATATAAWQACDEEIRTATSALAAGRTAAEHWRQHVGAQQKFDRGEITTAQAKEIWAKSKAPGPQDLRRFAAAKRAYDGAKGGCSGLGAAAKGTSAEQASACLTRAKLLGQAVASAVPVVGEWAAHQEMMATQDHSTTAYLSRWAAMVKAAPKGLNALQRAATRVDRAAACTIPSA